MSPRRETDPYRRPGAFTKILFNFRYQKNIFISNRLHLSICSLAASWAWSKVVGHDLLPVDWAVPPLTITAIYQINRLTDEKEDLINCEYEAIHSKKNASTILSVASVCVAASLILAFTTGVPAAGYIVLLVIILGVLYSKKGIIGKFRLKDFGPSKTLSVALGWSLITVVYPSIHSGNGWSTPLTFAFIYMLFSSAVIEIIWDIRDIKGDASTSIKSIAVIHGELNAKKVASIANILSLLLVVFGVAFSLLNTIWLITIGNNIYFLFLLNSTHAEILSRRKLSVVIIFIVTCFLLFLGMAVMIIVD